MASLLGTGPVAITTAQGAHLTIPLSALSYDGSAITITGWPPVPGAQDWVDYLFAEGQLLPFTPVGKAPPGNAFLVEATHPGLFSNAITLTISNVKPLNPPNMTTMDILVSVENDYPGLTKASLGEKIGTAAGGGSEPGLIYLSSADPPADLPDKSPTPVAMTGTPAHADIAGGGGTAFTLGGVADIGADITYTVEVPAAPVGDAFDLKVVWSKSVANKTLADHAPLFASIIKITAPPGGFGVPKADTYTLQNGADAGSTPTPAAPGTATIPPA